MSAKYFGKYRAVVVHRMDPQNLGRVLVAVPEVLGSAQGWAMPSVAPNASAKKLGSALPQEGAKVWVEFERGDPSFPIWSGCFFSSAAETPVSLRHA